MYSPDKMMGSKGLHGAPITAPGCFPSGRYSPPPYRAAPDPMPPPPRRCMPNSTVSETTRFLLDFRRILRIPPDYFCSRVREYYIVKFFAGIFTIYLGSWNYKYADTQTRCNDTSYVFVPLDNYTCCGTGRTIFLYLHNIINVKIKITNQGINLARLSSQHPKWYK